MESSHVTHVKAEALRAAELCIELDTGHWRAAEVLNSDIACDRIDRLMSDGFVADTPPEHAATFLLLVAEAYE